MATSLPQLPQEIKDLVFDHIHRHQEFAALARTCRQLYVDTLDRLYGTITWVWDCDRCESNVNPQPQYLLRTALSRPDLANRIKHIDITAVNYSRYGSPPLRPCDTPVLDKQTLELATLLIQSMSLHSSAWETNWINSLWEGSLTATLALAISQLHSLVSLRVSLDIVKQDHYVEAMLAHAIAAPTSTALSSFTHLHDIDLVPIPPERAQVSSYRPWLTPRGPDASLPLLRFPNLASASLLLPAIPFGTLSRQRHAPRKTMSNLTSLRLVRTSEKWSREALVLSQCPCLRELEFVRYCPVQTAVDFSGLAEGLTNLATFQETESTYKTRLEKLVVRIHPYYPPTEMKPRDFVGGSRFIPLSPVALRRLSGLKSLEVSALALGGWEADSRLQLGQYLPPNLEKLTLRNDCWSLEHASWWEDVCLEKVKAFLTQPSLIPTLPPVTPPVTREVVHETDEDSSGDHPPPSSTSTMGTEEDEDEDEELTWQEIVPRLGEVEMYVARHAETWSRSVFRRICERRGIRGSITFNDDYDYRVEYFSL